jgi:phosphoketolase
VASEPPQGLSDQDFDALCTKTKPIIFAFRGYPWLIHRLAYRQVNHPILHVRGYEGRGTITTPFDLFHVFHRRRGAGAEGGGCNDHTGGDDAERGGASALAAGPPQ